MDPNYDALRYLGNVLVVGATIVGAVSVYLHARVDWRASQMGRHLMFYMGAIESVFLLSCARLLIGDSWQFALLRLFVFALVPLAMTQRMWLQIKAQRGTRPNDDTPDHYTTQHDRAVRDVPRHSRDEGADR